jgi:hypothetical protein
MRSTHSIYSATGTISAPPSSVSRGLHDFLKRHTNSVWGAGAEVFDPKTQRHHPVPNNKREPLVAKFVRAEKVKPFVLTHADVERHLAGTQKFYFTGSKSAHEILIYLDADCHLPWQNDPDAAADLLREVLRDLYVCNSPRGLNGYVLFCHRSREYHMSAQNVNKQLLLLERSLRKLLLYGTIKTTIEVKGHVQHVDGDGYYCGRLGKLPNYGGMTADQLAALQSTSRVSPDTIRRFAARVDHITGITDDDIRAYYRLLKSHPDHPPSADASGRRAGAVITPVAAPPTPTERRADHPAETGGVTRQTGLLVGGDAFERGREICCALARRLKRVPSVQEVLTHIRETGQYTGDWSETEAARESRIADILPFTARNFDPTHARQPVAVDPTEFRDWVAVNYPTGIGKAKPEQVAVFLAITKFCVVTDPNEDGSLPYQRFESLWKNLKKENRVTRQFRWDFWRDVRDRLTADAVIHVHGTVARRQAQKWLLGPRFPGSSVAASESAPIPAVTDNAHTGAAAPSVGGRGGRGSAITLCLHPDGDQNRLPPRTTKSYQQEDAELYRMGEAVHALFGEDGLDCWRAE